MSTDTTVVALAGATSYPDVDNIRKKEERDCDLFGSV